MLDKQILLFLLLISISTNCICANESNEESYQESQITQPLDLTFDPNIIEESREQQNAINKKNNQFLPNLFKEQIESDVSIDSGILIDNEVITPEAIDGAEISIKVKTD